MATVSIHEAEAKLSELIQNLQPGDEVVITQNDQPVARLVPVATQEQPGPGTSPGTAAYMAPEYDDPLDDFKEYVYSACC